MKDLFYSANQFECDPDKGFLCRSKSFLLVISRNPE